jgi:hypothetical protein
MSPIFIRELTLRLPADGRLGSSENTRKPRRCLFLLPSLYMCHLFGIRSLVSWSWAHITNKRAIFNNQRSKQLVCRLFRPVIWQLFSLALSISRWFQRWFKRLPQERTRLIGAERGVREISSLVSVPDVYRLACFKNSAKVNLFTFGYSVLSYLSPDYFYGEARCLLCGVCLF